MSYGDVSFFGLDEFGAPAGLNPGWGAGAGALVQTGTAIGVRAFTSMDKWADGIGALAGVVAGGLMALFEGSRAAGWTAIATAAVGGGLRQLEQMMSSKEQAKAQTAGWGVAVINPAYPVHSGMRGLGQVEVQPLAGQMGIHTIQPAMIPGQMSGFGAPPAQLLGNAPAAQLLGNRISGLAGHYGATIFGGR